MSARISGLHLLGADSKDAEEKTDYTPYIQAAGGIAEGITRALKSPAPTPPPPPPPAESNAVWYVGGAAALAVVVALLLRSRW